MSVTTVTTQVELDAALAAHRNDPYAEIHVRSAAGVWLEISDTGRCYVRASGSATVRAWDSATVQAWGSATVQASKYVAVHLHSARATVEGGVLIDLTAVDERDAREWCEIHGANLVGDTVLLYKAVDSDYAAGHSYRLTTYAVGSTATALDWRADHSCGGGLHLSPHPEQALVYRSDAERMLLVEVDLVDLCPIPSLAWGEAAKCKVRACRVLREVALDGTELAGAA